MSIKDFAEKFIKAWQQALLNGKISDFIMLFDRSFVYHDAEIEASLEAYMQHIADLRKNLI